MAAIAMDKDNFQSLINENDTVIVDFWAPWCGPCQNFGPIFEKVSEAFPDAIFAKVNTDEQRELAATFQIQSIPTLMIFREKIIIFHQPGMLPEKAFTELVTKALELDMEVVRKEVAEQQAQAGGPPPQP